MAHFTSNQEEIVTLLVEIWWTGYASRPFYATLDKVGREGKNGKIIAAFLGRVYNDLKRNGHANYPLYSEAAFVQHLHERIDEIVQDASSKSTFRGRYHEGMRETNCWRCKRNLMASDDAKCPKCRWLRCECGACGCNYPAPRGDVFGGIGT